jgi:DNA mismatch repair protein MutS2
LKKAKQPLEAIQSIEEKIEKIEEKVEAPVERQTSSVARDVPKGLVKLGERVTVSTLNADGVVTALGESDAEVQIGSLRVRARLVDLVRRSGEAVISEQSSAEKAQKAEGSPRTMLSGTKSPGIELNLRGKLVDEGLEELEKYLERAYSAGLLFVRIVHGKGTGKLRDAVRGALKASPYVTSYEEPKDNEGGSGVTVAKIAK